MAKKPLFFLLSITFLIATQMAYAAILEEVAFVDKIGPNLSNLSIEESVKMHLTENKDNSILIAVPPGAHSISINDKPVASKNNSFSVTLKCEVCDINIKYSLDESIIQQKSEHDFEFLRTISFPQPKKFSYVINLPVGFIITPDDNDPPIVPAPSAITTDGKSIMVRWSIEEPALPSGFFIRFTHKHDPVPTDKAQWPKLWAYIIMPLLLIFSGVTAGKMLFTNNHTIRIPVLPSSIFSPDERAMLNMLKQYDKEMKALNKLAEEKPINQKEIARKLNWSRSKVSAVASNLERKEVIKREKFGRSYRVSIAKEWGD